MSSSVHYGLSDEIVCQLMDTTHRITPNIYLSGSKGSKDIDALKKANITCVISLCPTEENHQKDLLKANIKHHKFIVYDHPDHKHLIMEAAKEAHDIITKEKLNNGIVLVHCSAGISRSVTVLIYHLLRTHYELTPQTALELIRKIRPIAEPNDAFMKQLISYYNERFSNFT